MLSLEQINIRIFLNFYNQRIRINIYKKVDHNLFDCSFEWDISNVYNEFKEIIANVRNN